MLPPISPTMLFAGLLAGPAAESGAAEPGREAERVEGSEDERWIDRWAPENNMGELGVYGGVFFPAGDLELFSVDHDLPDQGRKRYRKAVPEFGARLGYYPLRFFGIEAEGGVMPSSIEAGGQALLWTVRGHLVGQLGLWSITPFVVVGAGALGVDSERSVVGNEVDATLHFGGGLKFFLNRHLLLRLDARDVIGAQTGVAEGVTNNLELLLGLSWTFGREPGAPAIDSDGDGLVDRRDRCPSVPGPRPSGCPKQYDDYDDDGIVDPRDECPKQPEGRNGYQDSDGCPDEVPAELVDLAGIMKGVQFDTDKDTIRPESEVVLKRGLAVMLRFPEIEVIISGHTDSRGGHAHNMDLSRRRAEAVERWLIEHGVDAARMETAGYGPDRPIADNESAAGRQENRRIEFEIVSRE